MVSCSSLGVVGAYQRDGPQGRYDPSSLGKYSRTNAADALAAGEHRRSNAPNTMGKHGRSDAADTLGEYGRSNAPNTLEIGLVPR